MDTSIRGNTFPTSAMTDKPAGALDKVSSGAHAAVDSMAEAADGVVGKTRPAIGKLATMIHHAVDRAAGAVAPTAGWLSERGEKLNAGQKKLVAGTHSYVTANPVKALGIAVVAGFVLSRILLLTKSSGN